MEAQREIYLTFTHNGHIVESDQPIPGNNSIKYIRADLAELTWEDMFKIVEIDMTLFERGTTQKDVENHFKEVLRRFLESKKEVAL